MGKSGSCLLLAALLAATASAAPKQPPFNVDVTVGWGNSYRPLEWTPIEVVIHPNLKKPFEGELTLEAQQDALTTMRIRRRITITPGRKERVPLVSKLVHGSGDCTVVIYDQRGRRQWGRSYGVGGFTGGQRWLTAVGHNELLVGASGRAGFGLLRVGRNLRSEQDTPRAPVHGEVHLRSKVTEMLPVDWTGYASLDALVLYDVDFSLLNRHQEEAIVEWVRRGGRLLLVLGRNVPPGERAIGKLLPFRPASPRRVRLPSAQLTRQWGCRPATGRGARKLTDIVSIWTIPDPPGPRWSLVQWTGHTAPPATTVPVGFQPMPVSVPAVAYGPVGLGMVGVLACDPSVVGGQQGENLAPFWTDVLSPLLDRRSLHVGRPQGQPDPFGMDGPAVLGTADSAANCVMEHLLTIPELKPLSIWWVIGLLLALAVLIGPLDYLLLKKLGRLPMTWLTSALYLTLFSVGAWYGVHALRAGAAQVRVVSVTDGVAGTDRAWRTSYCGIFAPVSDDYRLEGVRPTDQWWSSVAPTEGSDLHRFGQRSPSRQVTCVQGDGGNCPVSIPINIWSMQCLVMEGPADRMPFAATAHEDGREVSVRIQNFAAVPIREGWIRGANDRVTVFGSVQPGQTRTIAFRPDRSETARWDRGVPDAERWEHGRSPGSFTGEETYFAYGCRRRTRAIEGHLRRGAVVVCARYHDRRPPGFALPGGKGVYDHVHMARLVVFPQTAGPEPPREAPPRPVVPGRSRLE